MGAGFAARHPVFRRTTLVRSPSELSCSNVLKSNLARLWAGDPATIARTRPRAGVSPAIKGTTVTFAA